MNFGISIILKKNQLKMSLNFMSQISLQVQLTKKIHNISYSNSFRKHPISQGHTNIINRISTKVVYLLSK